MLNMMGPQQVLSVADNKVEILVIMLVKFGMPVLICPFQTINILHVLVSSDCLILPMDVLSVDYNGHFAKPLIFSLKAYLLN